MSLDTYLRRLARIDGLIRLENTGPTQAFANRLGMSRTNLLNYLNVLRGLGGEIRYSRRRQTYYYEDDKRFLLGYFEKGREIKIL